MTLAAAVALVLATMTTANAAEQYGQQFCNSPAMPGLSSVTTGFTEHRWESPWPSTVWNNPTPTFRRTTVGPSSRNLYWGLLAPSISSGSSGCF